MSPVNYLEHFVTMSPRKLPEITKTHKLDCQIFKRKESKAKKKNRMVMVGWEGKIKILFGSEGESINFSICNRI